MGQRETCDEKGMVICSSTAQEYYMYIVIRPWPRFAAANLYRLIVCLSSSIEYIHHIRWCPAQPSTTASGSSATNMPQAHCLSLRHHSTKSPRPTLETPVLDCSKPLHIISPSKRHVPCLLQHSLLNRMNTLR